MKTIIFAAITLSISTSAIAQGSRQPLGFGLSTGMTKAEVKAAIPTGSIAITDHCSISVDPVYKKGVVAFLRGNAKRGDRQYRCAETLLENLAAKYGEPETLDGANECDFFGSCTLAALGDALSSPEERLLKSADAKNGKRYFRYKSNAVTVDARYDVANSWVMLVYRPLVEGSVSAEAQSKL